MASQGVGIHASDVPQCAAVNTGRIKKGRIEGQSGLSLGQLTRLSRVSRPLQVEIQRDIERVEIALAHLAIGIDKAILGQVFHIEPAGAVVVA